MTHLRDFQGEYQAVRSAYESSMIVGKFPFGPSSELSDRITTLLSDAGYRIAIESERMGVVLTKDREEKTQIAITKDIVEISYPGRGFSYFETPQRQRDDFLRDYQRRMDPSLGTIARYALKPVSPFAVSGGIVGGLLSLGNPSGSNIALGILLGAFTGIVGGLYGHIGGVFGDNPVQYFRRKYADQVLLHLQALDAAFGNLDQAPSKSTS